jgi:hypothetical protein
MMMSAKQDVDVLTCVRDVSLSDSFLLLLEVDAELVA